MEQQVTPQKFLTLYEAINRELKKVIKGQDKVIQYVLIALLNGGHILVEGLPGLGKTLIANALSYIIKADFKRIQFTPDLMPSDIVGTTIFQQEKNEFKVKKGPVFTNFLLADEINRSPAKTQAALLEVMQEKQITIDGMNYQLEEPFITIATQNPIELEGTYPLPEAQLDRFMFKVLIHYPQFDDEKAMLQMFYQGFDSENLQLSELKPVCNKDDFVHYRKALQLIQVDAKILDYILQIVTQTRKTPGIEVGASPRATIALLKSSRTFAALRGRDFVVPDDVKDSAYPVLRHRIILESESEIEGNSPDDFIQNILSQIAVPR